MKTHDLAKSLNLMAKILRASPNVELAQFDLVQTKKVDRHIDDADMPTALMVMAALSKYQKADWVNAINEFQLAIPIKKTDSVRDLVGRFINYMAKNPHEVSKFSERSSESSARPSSELSEALSILLRQKS